MIPRDHNGADPGHAAFLNGLIDLRPAGVDHTVETNEGQGLFQTVGAGIVRQSVVSPARGGEYPESFIRKSLVDLPELFQNVLRHGEDLTVLQISGAVRKDHVAGTLGILDESVCRLMYRGHHFPVGIKRRFRNARLRGCKFVFREPDLQRVVDQRSLRGLAAGVILPGHELGVGA